MRPRRKRKRNFTASVKHHTMIPSKFKCSVDRARASAIFMHGFLHSIFRTDSTLAVIYATIGSTVNVSRSPKKNQKKFLNSFALNASMRVTHKSCFVCVANHTTKHNSTYAAISVRTGSMAVVLA